MNTTRYIILGIVILLVGFFLFGRNADAPEPGQEENERIAQDQNQGEAAGPDETVMGTVTEVDTEQAMVDGPYVVTVQTSGSEEKTILIPSMGIMLCAAREHIADPYVIQVGDTIEAKGSKGEQENSIIPCDSADHYVRVGASE